MNSVTVRKKYRDFFVARGHTEIPSASLVPENDPSTLFNSSGMQPLVQYFLGEPHPAGKRLVDSQKAIRLQDIDEVGDNRHTTFFEMLGNWSLGDYFKKEQLLWAFLYLTQEIGLDPQKLYVTVFEGNESVPKDKESIEIWKEIFSGVGIQAKEGERIFAYPAKKNWWSRSGEPENMPPGEPGGPDSEIFFDFGEELRLHEQSVWRDEKCHANCDCGRFMEIGNSVFMQYQKTSEGMLEELPQKNVDFGGGLERITAASINNPDVFSTDLFIPSITYLESISSKRYGNDVRTTTSMRIIVDHIRGAVMLLTDGVMPSNKQQGYVLRRLIRRSLMYGRQLGLNQHWEYIGNMVEPYAELYKDAYPQVKEQSKHIADVLEEEARRFGKTLEKGMNEIQKVEQLTGKVAFSLYETYGFPWEMTAEIATQKGQHVDKNEFESEFKKHQELSRTAASGMFKGGLADQSVQTTKLHTAHHLLLAALQQIVDPLIRQRGSNITSQRLRMDINLNRKLTNEEIKKLEELVNANIQKKLDVVRIDMPKEEAERVGAQMEFNHKYPDTVSVYYIGLDKNVPLQDVTHDHYISAEFCGGPHVLNTGDLGHFVIAKQESSGSGIRRIYATLS
jgi:alanyl-tRNA synthetase